MSTTTKIASNISRDRLVRQQFPCQFAIRVCFDGNRRINTFDKAHFIKHKNTRVVLVAVGLDVFKRNVHQCKPTVEEVFNTLEQRALIGENLGCFFHEFAAALLYGVVGCTELGEFSGNKEAFGGRTGCCEPTTVAHKGNEHVLGRLLIDCPRGIGEQSVKDLAGADGNLAE